MSKGVALLLVLVFLAASCLTAANPAFSSVAVVEDTWASKAPLPQGKSGGLVVVNGKIYAIGGTIQNYVDSWTRGFSGVSEAVNSNYEYDPALDKWTIKPPMPTPRYGFGIVVYEDSIYCIGGFQNNFNARDGRPGAAIGTVAVEVFHLTTNKWKNKTSMPTRMGDFAAMIYDGNIYCIGEGINEVYNIATDTWQTKALMPFNGSIVTANVVNGKLYVTSDSQMYVYNPATDSWLTKALIQTVSYGTLSAVIGNRIYVISVNLTQIYDTETDTVSLGTPPPSDFNGGIAFATTGEMAPERIYILDVRTTLPVGVPQADVTLQVYNPEADSWVIGAKMPTPRVDVGFALVDEKIYAIGGNTATTSPGVYPAYPDVSVMQYATNEEYTPFGYGTVGPVIDVASPENINYTSSEVALNFTVNRHVEWMGYSLDGNENVTITGNITLTGLSNGFHNITVYAKDTFENTGTSETISFTITEEPEPFPTMLVVASVASVAVVGVGLLVYFKRRKH